MATDLLCPVRGLVGHIQRYSTLFPIVGRKTEDKTLPEKVLLTQRMWQRRVFELSAQLDIPLKTMSLCKPAFFYTRNQMFTCKRTNICPFCFARQVSKIFDDVCKACEGGGYQIVQLIKKFKILCETTEEMTTNLDAGVSSNSIRYRRRNMMRMINPAGAIIWNLFVPAEGLSFEVHSRQIYIFRNSQRIPTKLLSIEKPVYKLYQCRSEDRTVFARQLSRVFEYPKAYLNNSLYTTACILRAISNHKMFHTFGIMRGIGK